MEKREFGELFNRFRKAVDDFSRLREEDGEWIREMKGLIGQTNSAIERGFFDLTSNVKSAMDAGLSNIKGALEDLKGELIQRLVSAQGAQVQREGMEFQQESAQDFELLGFAVKNAKGREEPDHLLHANGRLVAVASAKSYTIKESWALNPPRAGEVEIEFARKHGVPLVCHILNKHTGREWVRVIPPEGLGEHFSITAPKWLWKPELAPEEEAERRRDLWEATGDLLRLLGGEGVTGKAEKATETSTVSPRTLRPRKKSRKP